MKMLEIKLDGVKCAKNDAAKENVSDFMYC